MRLGRPPIWAIQPLKHDPFHCLGLSSVDHCHRWFPSCQNPAHRVHLQEMELADAFGLVPAYMGMSGYRQCLRAGSDLPLPSCSQEDCVVPNGNTSSAIVLNAHESAHRTRLPTHAFH